MRYKGRLCDICGAMEDNNFKWNKNLNIKIKLKRYHKDPYGGGWWDKLDLCPNCAENLFKLLTIAKKDKIEEKKDE